MTWERMTVWGKACVVFPTISMALGFGMLFGIPGITLGMVAVPIAVWAVWMLLIVLDACWEVYHARKARRRYWGR